MWKIIWKGNKKKRNIDNPVLITGLPGIGNVGKIVVDTMINELNAKKIASFYSHHYPNSVIVHNDNTVALPSIDLYHVKKKKRNFLLLTGDIQPSDESSYAFCEKITTELKKIGLKLIITLGGIGLKKPSQEVYITGNNKKAIKKFSEKTRLKKNVYKIVGPVYGVSGVLPGIAEMFNVNAIILLAETKTQLFHFASKEAVKILKLLDKKYSFELNFKEIKKDMKELEKVIEGITFVNQKTKSNHKDINYIG